MTTPLAVIKKCIRGIATPFFQLRRKLPIDIEEITVKSKCLTDGLNGCRLAVIADLHLPDNIVDIDVLLTALREAHLDGILLAGDLINRYNLQLPAETAAFLNAISAIAPTFAIAGNHEILSDHLTTYQDVLKNANIAFLCDRHAPLCCKGESLYIYGVCDTEKELPKKLPQPAVLLIHNPEHAVKACENGFICAVCGHAHGGQVRFGKRGLFAPGQGLFPRYISGCYVIDAFPIIVSRGLGDSSLPIRIHNRPHLPIITLLCE